MDRDSLSNELFGGENLHLAPKKQSVNNSSSNLKGEMIVSVHETLAYHLHPCGCISPCLGYAGETRPKSR